MKVLAEAFARDTGRMSRFQREAEVLAALNHPNIAQIYGAEEHALVMELVEGLTLAERIQQGAIPLDESLEIARQIAEALEAAHEKGIVHRDLKPSNVKIKADGTVKVLDFGLAAILQTTASGATDPANSPTLTIGGTQAGAILGTAGYMSPEQAVGKPVDRRADIWAFGVVLFEMLTGQRLFTGETPSHILAGAIKGEIDFGTLPSATPAAVRHLLKRCLDRDVKMRLQAIGEARVAISNPAVETEASAPSRSRLGNVAAAIAVVMTLTAAVAGWALWRATRPVEKPLIRLDVDLGPEISLSPPDNSFVTLVLSPDGTRIAYRGSSAPGGPPRLFTRRLDQPKATELPTTGSGLSFSPDGRWIGFYGGGKFNKISVEGGAVVPLVDAVGVPGGASWQEDGNIIVVGAATPRVGAGGLSRISSGGGAPTKVTEANGEFGHLFPQTLPGGKAILFVAYPTISPDKAHVDVIILADGRRKTLVPGGTSARYVPTANGSGHLLYANKGTLFAIPFDLDRLETRGTAVPILRSEPYFGRRRLPNRDWKRPVGCVPRRNPGLPQGKRRDAGHEHHPMARPRRRGRGQEGTTAQQARSLHDPAFFAGWHAAGAGDHGARAAGRVGLRSAAGRDDAAGRRGRAIQLSGLESGQSLHLFQFFRRDLLDARRRGGRTLAAHRN